MSMFITTGYTTTQGADVVEARSFHQNVSRATDFNLKSLAAVARRAVLFRKPLWLRITQLPRKMGLIHRIILSGADVVIVDSAHLAHTVRAIGVAESRIVHLSEPGDLTMFAEAPRSRTNTDVWRLVHVGDLEPEAGVADLLACLTAWAGQHRDRRIEMLWAGEGCMQGMLEAQPIPPNMTQVFLGTVSRTRLGSLFTTCDVFVAPAVTETWSQAVAEAMVSGLPILGSNRLLAVRELVTEGETGWIFNPFELGSMIRAIELAWVRHQSRWAA
jgi:glycosyltransferase involved in cell wall biosynthesis